MPTRESSQIPVVTTEATSSYLSRIGAVPLLDAFEEIALAEVIVTGRVARAALEAASEASERQRVAWRAEDHRGTKARETMIAANLRLVVALARGLESPGMSFLDLVQEGNIGLVRAVDHFDPRRGTRFSPYARWWIRESLGRALDRGRAVTLPVRRSRQMRRCQETAQSLRTLLGRAPTVTEIAAESGVAEIDVRALTRWASTPASLDDPASADPPAAGLSDPVVTVLDRVDALEVRRAVARLPRAERDVVVLLFGLEGERLTQARTAERLGVTPADVARRRGQALGRLRESARAGEEGWCGTR